MNTVTFVKYWVLKVHNGFRSFWHFVALMITLIMLTNWHQPLCTSVLFSVGSTERPTLPVSCRSVLGNASSLFSDHSKITTVHTKKTLDLCDLLLSSYAKTIRRWIRALPQREREIICFLILLFSCHCRLICVESVIWESKQIYIYM